MAFTLSTCLQILCVCAESFQTLPSMDCSPPSSSVHGTFPARILEWVAIFFSRGPSCPGDQTCISWIFPTQGWNPGLLNCRQILYHLSHQGNSCIFIMCVHVKSLQLCPTLCNPMVCSPPGPSVHRILQARIMESVAMPSSRDLLDPGMEPISLMSPALAGGFFTTRATWKVPVRSLEEGVTCPSTCSIVGCQR